MAARKLAAFPRNKVTIIFGDARASSLIPSDDDQLRNCLKTSFALGSQRLKSSNDSLKGVN